MYKMYEKSKNSQLINEGISKMIKIIYEDNQIIVIEKPINIPVQADSSKDYDLVTMVKDYLKEKYHKPGNVYVGLVHRLDRPVGGLMVFAKTSKSASRLSLEIRNQEFHKTYLAVCEGLFKCKKGTFIDSISKDEKGNSRVDINGLEAVLDYEVLEEIHNNSLVKINLHTGRHHQIRVQMAYHKHPLCGDQRYNKMDKTQIALYACELDFIHPVTKIKMHFTHLPPKKGYFQDFTLINNKNKL